MRAFPREGNVRLRVKAMPRDDVAEPRDRRIEVIRKNMSQEELSNWYSSLTCFVSASRAEAWGLMHLQAMAVGRPVIACRFGGLEEFFDEDVGFCVDYHMGPATGRYSGQGTWAIPDQNSLSQRMRDVYRNPSEVREKGVKSCARALDFTWARSCDQLYRILIDLHVFRR
jgi:glycosyltransferase involved in cell wall biosynthesis